MSDELELSISELRNKRAEKESANGNGGWPHQEPQGSSPRGGSARIHLGGSPRTHSMSYEPSTRPFNIWRFVEIMARRWLWLVAGSLLLAGAAFLFGLWITNYTATARLIRRETLNAFTGGNDGLAPRPLTEQTLFGLMRAPEIIRRASARALEAPISPDHLAKAVRIVPERNPDFVSLAVSGKADKGTLAYWANLYAEEVVAYMRDVQSGESKVINDALKLRLVDINQQVAEADNDLIEFARGASVVDFDREVDAFLTSMASIDLKFETAQIDRETVDLKIKALQGELGRQSPVSDELTEARARLAHERTLGKRDAHPDVVRALAMVEMLEKRNSGAAQTAPATPRISAGPLAAQLSIELLHLNAQKQSLERQVAQYGRLKNTIQERTKFLSSQALEYAQKKARRNNLEITRGLYQDRQRNAQLVQENAMGYFRIFSPASPEGVSGKKRFMSVTMLTFIGAIMGAMLAAAMALIAEVMDGRIKTVADVQRVTRLPMLATLGDLRHMSPADQVSWAFRTLTILQGKLSSTADQSLVCGFVSSKHGEGRSTWINLLVSAASQRGLRVLTVATRDTHGRNQEEQSSGVPSSEGSSLLPVGPTTTLNTNVLAFPDQVTEQFADPKAQPLVHIPLPGWVWNLERRKQWNQALMHWARIENLVLLVELPPACEPESVLLAEHLPQVIWLTGSGIPDAQETALQLDTLRHARCNLVGAVLNREPTSFWTGRMASWMRRFSVAALSFFAVHASAAETTGRGAAEEPAIYQGSFSGVKGQRPEWVQRLTLGPGDIVDISVFRQPDLTRTNVLVTPDGRLTYLQVQELPVVGMTIDELRLRLDEELAPLYFAPRTLVVPVAFTSKKYFVLGKVASRGAYVLDRPLTIIEAVARARGLETGLVDRDTVEIADFSRSFLVRRGQRIPLDFEKLFFQGDFSQNIQIEPNDYLYFGSSAAGEVYLLGEVLQPGPVPATGGTTVITALTARGGFTPEAYRKKVLLVRGSLNHPETFILDTVAILDGRTPDFKLQPRDILYVSARPWARVEELLDIAAQSFIQGAITGWVGGNIGPVIKSPILPQL